jgi:hypothetical protein
MALFGTDLQFQFPDGLRGFSLDLTEEESKNVLRRGPEQTTKVAILCCNGLIVIFIDAESIKE